MGEFRWRLVDEGQDGLFERQRRVVGIGEYRSLTFWEVEARSIINEVPAAARLPFRYTINPYRGCSHGCVYCFARPTHDYLGFDIGEDFDTQIVVKLNAVELLRAETQPGRWAGDPIAMGTNTDPYQKAEGKYRLTRGIVEILMERGNPFSILTKSTLALRDIDLFVQAAGSLDVSVNFSIPTLDEDVWRETEPGTPKPSLRMQAVRRLNESGVPSGVMMAPLLPGISDTEEQVETVRVAAREAGATFVTPMKLHLKPGVKEHYMDWLAGTHPDLVSRYEELYRGRAYLPGERRRSSRKPATLPRAAATKPEQLRLI